MTRKYFLSLFTVILLLLSSSALGQDGDYPKVEVFGGFSYFSADAGTRESFFGWQASISANFHENIGFTLDSGGQYDTNFGITLEAYEFLLGPRYIIRGERFTGFAHALIGLEHAHAGGFSDTAFAMGFGGGVDVNASDRIAIRAFQLDYIPVRSSGVWTHDARVGAGVVFRFLQ
jgi:opacity protein-like surface antigen